MGARASRAVKVELHRDAGDERKRREKDSFIKELSFVIVCL